MPRWVSSRFPSEDRSNPFSCTSIRVVFVILPVGYAGAQFLAGFEERHALGLDADGCARARIAPDARIARAHRKGAKTTDFHAVATFAQTRPTSHPEAYGLFFAGNDLAGEGQRYIYFIVRADGKFQVKRRAGAEVTNLTPWTDHAAIAKAGEDGKAKNTLEIDANGEKVALKVNGTTVYELAEASRAGVVGLRLNHGLDVHIDGFAVHPS